LKINFMARTTNKWIGEYNNKPIPDTLNLDIFRLHKKAIEGAVKELNPKPNMEYLTKYHALAIQHNETIQRFLDAFSADINATKTKNDPRLIYFIDSLSLEWQVPLAFLKLSE
jgi:hypothetical protein